MPHTPHGYKPGDWYITDDRTGKKIRASEAVKEWTGQIVHRDEYEPRHPQEFVRGLKDNQTVPDPRPDPIPTFLGALDTTMGAAAVAGATSIVPTTTVRMAVLDYLMIGLDNGDMQRVRITAISDPSIGITPGLKFAAAAGNVIVDVTAQAAPTLP